MSSTNRVKVKMVTCFECSSTKILLPPVEAPVDVKVTTVTKAIGLNLERSYLFVEHVRFGLGRAYLES